MISNKLRRQKDHLKFIISIDKNWDWLMKNSVFTRFRLMTGSRDLELTRDQLKDHIHRTKSNIRRTLGKSVIELLAVVSFICPPTKIVNRTNVWNDKDVTALKEISVRCSQIYIASPCLKTLSKAEEQVYSAMCGAELEVN